MTIPVWGLLGVFTSTFVAPFVSAVTPIPLALPQTVRYDEYIASQLASAEFSSDPQHLLSIYEAAGQAGSENHNGPFVTAFVYSGSTCSTVGDEQDYRIVLHNIGNEGAKSLSVQNLYPEFTKLVKAEPEATHNEERRLITWTAQELASGGTLTFNLRVKTEQAAAAYLDNLTVYYDDGTGNLRVTIGERSMSGVCTVTDSIRSFIAGRAAPKPAVFCDPAEQQCDDTFDQVDLGPNYRKALLPENQPTICSLHDQQLRQGQVPPCQDKLPQLGPRFAEAMADIIPGECRTLEDNRIILPGLNDALNRRSQPAAFYMSPLTGIAQNQSGNDYKRLVHENSLLGINNLDGVRDQLVPVHNSNWTAFMQVAREVAAGSRSPDAGVTYVMGEKSDWSNNIQSQHSLLESNFAAMQNIRAQNFSEVLCGPGGNINQVNGCKLLANAQATIRNSCCTLEKQQQASADAAQGTGQSAQNYECPNTLALGAGGLEGGIRQVKTAYEQSLNNSAFAAAQSRSLNNYRIALDDWTSRFATAVNEFKTGNSDALTQFIREGQENQLTVFADDLMGPYREHTLEDINSDNEIRRGVYTNVLDAPKEIATSCAKELPDAYDAPDVRSVELTMCENGVPTEPQVQATNLRQATHEIYSRQPVAPPLITQVQVTIDQRLTFGSPCSGRPGDPWWAEDCSCDCGEIIAIAEDSLQFCNAGEGYYTTGGQPPPSGWPRPEGIPSPYVYNNTPNSLAGWWKAIISSSQYELVSIDWKVKKGPDFSRNKHSILIELGHKLIKVVQAQTTLPTESTTPLPPINSQDPLLTSTASPNTSPVSSPDVSVSPLATPPPPISPDVPPPPPTPFSPDPAPTVVPTVSPVSSPDVSPVVSPSISPALSPGVSPGISPGVSPALSPGVSPGISPDVSVSPLPTPTIPISPDVPPPPPTPIIPTPAPTIVPTVSPVISPSTSPVISPSVSPVISPSISLVISPSVSVSPLPTLPIPVSPIPPPPPPTPVIPTPAPTIVPTVSPVVSPSTSPVISPSPSLPPCPSASPAPSPSPLASPSPPATPETTTTPQATPSPSPQSITWHDIWVTSKEECLANFQGCHHFNASGECEQEGPSPEPSVEPSPSLTPLPSVPVPTPSVGQTPQPSPMISPRLCVNPDGTIVYY